MDFAPRPHWLARSIGSATFTPALLVLAVALTLWSLGRSSVLPGKALWISATLLAVAAGCVALAFIRPQRAGLSPPHVMLTLGFGGMLLGLLWDVLHSGPARLDSLCLQSTGLGFHDSLVLHLEFLPGMHAGMLVGGLAAIPSLRLLRPYCGRYLCSLFAQNLMCSAWMLIGMTAGALWLARWQASDTPSTLVGMLGGMFAGMTWGMVLSVALYRGFFAWRKRSMPA